jgi:hypothetical protein
MRLILHRVAVVGSKGEECLASIDAEEPAKSSFRPSIPQDDEDSDVPDMLECEDLDNVVENDVVRILKPCTGKEDWVKEMLQVGKGHLCDCLL